jgi:hypothetical protein
LARSLLSLEYFVRVVVDRDALFSSFEMLLLLL